MKPYQAARKLLRIEQELRDMLSITGSANYYIQKAIPDVVFARTLIEAQVKPALFRSRTTDPDTSKQAECKSRAKADSDSGRIITMLKQDAYVCSRIPVEPGFTASEIAHELGLSRAAVGKRMSEVAKDSGRRRKNDSGFNEIVWTLT